MKLSSVASDFNNLSLDEKNRIGYFSTYIPDSINPTILMGEKIKSMLMEGYHLNINDFLIYIQVIEIDSLGREVPFQSLKQRIIIKTKLLNKQINKTRIGE